MFRNHLLAAWRNFRRNKFSTFVNIFGLAIGTSTALIIFLIVQYDYSFEQFRPDKDRIYRVNTHMKSPDGESYFPAVPHPLPDAVGRQATGLDGMTFVRTNEGVTMSPDPGTNAAAAHLFFDQMRVAYVDTSYFNLFPAQWMAGNPSTALRDPYQVVLSESRARLYFPGVDPSAVVGRQLRMDDSVHLTVSGIIKDEKRPTDLYFEVFMSYPTLMNTSLKNGVTMDWNSYTTNDQLFLRLSKGVSPHKVETELSRIDAAYNKQADKKTKVNFQLEGLTDMHLDPNSHAFGPAPANRSTLRSLILVAIFFLLMACVNYVNLSTAQASLRAREIGVRKTMGSSRAQLIHQFLAETLLLMVGAAILSALLAPFLIKAFSDFIPPGVQFQPISHPFSLLFLMALVAVISLLSGFYPAFVLSSMRPALILKNQITSGRTSRRAWLRSTLTVFQFGIAQSFVLGTLLVSAQIRYSLHTNMGFRKAAVVYFEVPFNYMQQEADPRPAMLAEEIRQIPGIERVSLANFPPASSGWSSTSMTYKGGPSEIALSPQVLGGDTNFLHLYGLHLLAGRNVGPSDTMKEMVINETFLHTLHFKTPQEALGKLLYLYNNVPMPIVGVMANFHTRSVHDAIGPVALFGTTRYATQIHIALSPDNPQGTAWKKTLTAVENRYKATYPGYEFTNHFLDKDIADLYSEEQEMDQLLTWATGLAILISCLGMLGLVLHTTRQRVKEIGVRKVLGASASRIIALLTGGFLRLVGLSFVIAAPIAWYWMHQWLNDYTYKVSPGFWIFAEGGLMMILVALLTLGAITIRAARANPVESLRTE